MQRQTWSMPSRSSWGPNSKTQLNSDRAARRVQGGTQGPARLQGGVCGGAGGGNMEGEGGQEDGGRLGAGGHEGSQRLQIVP